MSATKGPTLTTSLRASRDAHLAVAIDGGNSKTEVVVLAPGPDGALVETARAVGPGSGAGPGSVVAAVAGVLAGVGVEPVAVRRVSAAVAGVDLPGDDVGHRTALAALFPNARVDVAGDAVAVLDAGAGLAHALAIVSGAGLNAVARGPFGLATVPALGWVSGDWGGGDEIGREAVRAAARAEDGRGPQTRLLPLVLAETGASDTIDLARGIRDGAVTMRQVGALASVVAQAAANGDAVAAALIARAADEAVRLARVTVRAAWAPRPSDRAEGAPDSPSGGPQAPAGVVPVVDAEGRVASAPALRDARAVPAGIIAAANADGPAPTSAPPSAAAVLAATPTPVPPGTPAVLAGGMFSDDGFRERVSAALRADGFDPRPLAFRPVDGLVRVLREESAAS